MKKLNRLCVAVDQGEVVLFSAIEDDGEMWTGTGPREVTKLIPFSEPFAAAPTVHVSPAMWDIEHRTNSRFDLTSEEVTAEGFTVRFRTWGDTRVGRIRVAWLAIGQVADDEAWDV
jgi:hypothetical protein